MAFINGDADADSSQIAYHCASFNQDKMPRFPRLISAICLLCCCAAGQRLSAQVFFPAEEEIWPEVDLYYKIANQHRLFLLVSGTRQNNSSYSDGSVGVHYDFFTGHNFERLDMRPDSMHQYNLWLRAGYMYAASPPSQEDAFRENTIVTEVNPRFYLKGNWLLTNKNRLDWRVKDGDFSVRYRPRLIIEKDFFTGYATFTAYAYGEYFINFGNGELDRFRLCAGMEFWLFHFLSVEYYYLHQFPNDPEVGQVDALGVAAKWYFQWKKRK
jgi:hypothetical protein